LPLLPPRYLVFLSCPLNFNISGFRVSLPLTLPPFSIHVLSLLCCTPPPPHSVTASALFICCLSFSIICFLLQIAAPSCSFSTVPSIKAFYE
jgi:hypothetical protein